MKKNLGQPVIDKTHSSKVTTALDFATAIHSGQKRKGKSVDYITHPIAVSKILQSVTDDENIIIAGLLHDTIEDCDPHGSVTKEDIRSKFGEEVAEMVDSVTEHDKSLSWKKRKQAGIDHIKHMSHNSMLVKSADVLNNLQDLNQDIKDIGAEVLSKFSAPAEDIVERYNNLISELKKNWADNPLIPKLERELDLLNNLMNLYVSTTHVIEFYKTYEWGDVEYGVKIDDFNFIGEETARSLYTNKPIYHTIESEYLRHYGYKIDESEASNFIRQFAKDIKSGKVDMNKLYSK